MHKTIEPMRAFQRKLEEESFLIEDQPQPNLPQLSHQTLSQLTATTVTKLSPTHPSLGIITTPPSLFNRAALPEPQAPTDCNSQINQFKSQFSVQNSQQISQLSQQAAVSISQAISASSSAKSVANAANTALAAVQTSASLALSSASSSVSIANSNASAASVSASGAIELANSSASSMVAIASTSASSAIVSASSSVSSALLSASSVVAAAQASASAAVSNASNSIEEVRATATFAISQAQATVSSVNAQAAASVKASQVQAITATQAAIAIVGSIIGSSLLSILGYVLLTRYKKRKQLQLEQTSQIEKTEYIPNGKNSASSLTYRLPSESYVEPSSVFEFTLPREKKRPFWSFGSAKDMGTYDPQPVTTEEPRANVESRKTTLVYDSEFPTEPPRFETQIELPFKTRRDGEAAGGIEESGRIIMGKEEEVRRETIGAAI